MGALARPGRLRYGTPRMTRRGLILDRDGVVNHDTGYLHRIADCRFVDGVFAMSRAFAALRSRIVCCSCSEQLSNSVNCSIS